jgi:predicted Zn-dependent protease
MSGGRFKNLEFPDGRRGPQPGSPGGPGAQPAPDRHFIAEVRDAAYYLAQAGKHELAGDFERALRSFSAALGENPLCLEAWVGQLLMLLDLEEYPEARTWADKALEKFPDHPQLLAAKAVAFHRMGLDRQARDLCDAALAAKGESALVWLCRGELMLAISAPAAEDCFARALRLAERKAAAQMRIGAVCLRCGKQALALSALQEASAALPRSALAWFLVGEAQAKLGLAERSRASYRQAAELAPGNDRYAAAANPPPPSWGAGLSRFFGRLFGK